MSLLCSLAVRDIIARAAVLLAIKVYYLLLAGSYSKRREVHAVGTHICNMSVLIEVLRDHHCLADGISKLSRRLLLQCRRSEWWCRRAFKRFLGYISDLELSVLAHIKERYRLLMGLEPMVEFRLHLTLGAVLIEKSEHGVYPVIGFRIEFLNLAFAFDYQAHRNALHAPCRQCRLYLPPQHRRDAEAHQSVKYAACLLRVDQVHVKVARMIYSLKDCRLRDFMEHDATGFLLVKSQDLTEMPADSLSLAVLIGCEPHLLGFFSVLFQFADDLAFLLRNNVVGFQRLCINAELFLLQVANVPIARHHLIVFSQKFLNSLGLCRALNNN